MDITTAIDRAWFMHLLEKDHKEVTDSMRLCFRSKVVNEVTFSYYKGRADYIMALLRLLMGKKYQNAVEAETRGSAAIEQQKSALSSTAKKSCRSMKSCVEECYSLCSLATIDNVPVKNVCAKLEALAKKLEDSIDDLRDAINEGEK